MSNNTRLAELMNYITIDTTSGNQFQMSGSIKQTSVTSALLKANATGVLTAATAGTDYLTSVGISNLTATGTPSATTYLRGDNTWATVSAGASSISTLSDVVITSIANRNLLQYDSGTSKWVNIPNYLITGITTGSIFVGVSAGNLTLTGTSNTFIGNNAGSAATSAINNTALGLNALLSNATGNYHTAIGTNSLANITGSQSSVAIGNSSGRFISGGGTIHFAGSNSIFIGDGAFPLANSQTNQIVIGGGAVGLGSNTTVLGNSSTVDSVIYGNLVLGSTSTGVGYKLNVTGTTIHNNTSAMDTGVILGTNQLTSGSLGTLPANWSGTFAGGYVITAGGGTLTSTLSLPQYSYFVATITANVTTTGTFDIYCGGTSGDAYWSSGSLPVGTATSSKTSFTTAAGTTSLVAGSSLVATISNIQIQLVTGVITPNVTFNSSTGGTKIEIRLDNNIQNTYIGFESGAQNYTGFANTTLGYRALLDNLIGTSNTAIGASALQANRVGNYNTALGASTLSALRSGSNNVAVGISSLSAATTASWNVAVGREALNAMLGGSNNTAIGDIAFRVLGTGSNNLAIGESAGRYITSGGSNVFIGAGTGQSAAVAINNSILIGQGATVLATGQTNQIVIGQGSAGLGSNTTVIGNSSTTQTAIYGNLTLGGTANTVSALLSMTSTTQGFLQPVMTTTQKNAITTPATGLSVYDSTISGLSYYNGTAWKSVQEALGFTPYNATNPSGYISANQTITLSGVVTGSGTTAITTAIAAGAITNAMLANGAVANLSGTNTGDQTDISGNAVTAGGLAVATGRNNAVNQIVRTDANGYIQCGYINSSNGNENNNANADRVWGTNGSDDYLRTYRTSALSVSYAASSGNSSTTSQTAFTTLSTNGGNGYHVSFRPIAGATFNIGYSGGNIGTNGAFINSTFNGNADPSAVPLYFNASVFSYFVGYSEQMRLVSGGTLYIGGGISQNYSSWSDRKLKENLKVIDNALDKISKLTGYTFEWKKDSPYRNNPEIVNRIQDAGLIAQDVELVLPEIVKTTKESFKTVNYDGIIGLHTEGIKELIKQNQELLERVKQLEAKSI